MFCDHISAETYDGLLRKPNYPYLILERSEINSKGQRHFVLLDLNGFAQFAILQTALILADVLLTAFFFLPYHLYFPIVTFLFAALSPTIGTAIAYIFLWHGKNHYPDFNYSPIRPSH